jgi:uncharacterized protein (DUF1499 family)
MPWKIILTVAVLSVLGWVLTMAALSLAARRPDNLGVRGGRLPACPASPNCVCSQDADPGHAVEPLRFTGGPGAAWRRLREVLAGQPRTRVVDEGDGYLHAECTSLVFRFVDDLEFLLDPAAGVIHVRSASRVGRSDLGVNRARVEAVRRAFAAADAP